jgi:hypothetical protein
MGARGGCNEKVYGGERGDIERSEISRGAAVVMGKSKGKGIMIKMRMRMKK